MSNLCKNHWIQGWGLYCYCTILGKQLKAWTILHVKEARDNLS